jgi:hypothetical protein
MITINLHNYEHYFLLWVDGELSSDEMVVVERFIADHPELAEELALLQDTKLAPDEHIIFTGKDQLFKQPYHEITLSNYESWFLMYVDHELILADQAKVELFVLQHPSLQAEFELLQQTKLVSEEWIFKHKEVLYRKEEQKRPVIFMRWMRYAAAAAVIGLIALVWFIAPTNQLNMPVEINGVQPELVGNQPDIQSDQDSKPGSLINEKPSSVLGETSSAKPDASTQSSIKVSVVQNIGNNHSILSTISNEPTKKEEPLIARVENEPILQKKIEQPANDLIVGRTNIEDKQGTNIEPADQQMETLPEEVKTVYTALDDSGEDKSLYIGALELNKDKLRGLFRKAGTIFRSKAKQEEDTRQRK